MELSDQELTALASKLRSAYSRRKRKDTLNFRLSPRYSQLSLWQKNARRMLEAGGSVDEWIEAGFEYNTLPNGPYPHAFGTDNATRNYHQYKRMHTNGEASDSVALFVEESFHQFARLRARNASLPPDLRVDEESLVLDEWNGVRPFVAVALFPGNSRIRERFLVQARAFVNGSRLLLDAIEKCGGDTSVFQE